MRIPDTLQLEKRLSSEGMTNRVIVLEEVDSTNTYASRLARDGGTEGTVVVARNQTSGRGRHGRKWISEPRKNLTFSMILKPEVPIDRLGMIPILAGLSVAEALTAFLPNPAICKWPNDVLVGNRKICGILSESFLLEERAPVVVVGFGVNINQRSFDGELGESATSMSNVASRAYDPVIVLISILRSLSKWYDEFLRGHDLEIVNGWRSRTRMIGLPAAIMRNGEMIKGTVLDIDIDGGLLLQRSGNIVKVIGEEVSLEH